ncbi:uncharacterized protein LY79DRAFT_588449 [Colletotrichum navitas]|uniref:DUF1772-domain-containing protein n=1 Tax=Colletotrichum navitas TaxID=681940 RepID=A0AAD8Q591_9PEZI|nr:uncharacterized protein LY79DRAFT_588449 [Colletotrichum navitas]KAK1595885.1 hypothetical protein LY79DRAFT_588449 [Colletotrichum navitas]
MLQLGLITAITTATGILGCAWWAGATASLSMFSVPTILQGSSEPAHALRLWRHIFLNGASTGPKVALVTFLSLAYTAYDHHNRGAVWKPYATAAVLSLAIMPFTLVVMSSTNNALMAGAQGVETLSLSETTELLTRWRTLNLVRSFISLASAGIGLWCVTFQ